MIQKSDSKKVIQVSSFKLERPEFYLHLSTSLMRQMRSSRNQEKKAWRKFEVPMPAAMPCKSKGREHRETEVACIVEADESTRKRMEGTLRKDHEDHIEGKRTSSLNHYNFVHKFFFLPQAMKILAAKEAVDRKQEKLEKILAWQLTKDRNKRSEKKLSTDSDDVGDGEVVWVGHDIVAALSLISIKCKHNHFVSVMDICHLKNSESEPKIQKHMKTELYSEVAL